MINANICIAYLKGTLGSGTWDLAHGLEFSFYCFLFTKTNFIKAPPTQNPSVIHLLLRQKDFLIFTMSYISSEILALPDNPRHVPLLCLWFLLFLENSLLGSLLCWGLPILPRQKCTLPKRMALSDHFHLVLMPFAFFLSPCPSSLLRVEDFLSYLYPSSQDSAWPFLNNLKEPGILKQVGPGLKPQI